MQVIVDGIIYNLQANGGISRIFHEILPRMCEMDDSLHLILLTDGPVSGVLPTHRRIEHRMIPQVSRILRPERLWRPIVPQVRQALRKWCLSSAQGKIWHSTYFTNPGEKGVPLVVSVYDMIFERFPELFSGAGTKHFNELKRRCVLAADAVLCISETTRRDVMEFYGLKPDRAHVIHLAYSPVFRTMEKKIRADLPSPEPYFLYVGSRVHYKKFDLLLDTFSRYSRKDMALFVVGPPWTTEEIVRLETLKLCHRVYLFKEVDDDLLSRFYNEAEAFIYPSLYEGFGIPLLEAMACGCPVIASRIPSTVEVAGDCPLYVEPADLDDLIHAFDLVLAEGRHSERVKSGLEHVKRYSWDKTAEKTLEIYRSLS
ncbi:MAG: glycosyltransferase family 1 protein [Rectinemataceae bacterium]|nr:glycosyltransferase family 1 protein [Rectinemataceae bacterium]